jgi:hypothetical protein
LGISESGAIGTLDTSEGSLSAIFPLLISIVLFSYYLYNRKKSYLFLIFCYFLFAIIGAKRVITVALPVFLLITLMIYYKKNSKLFSVLFLKKLASYLGIGFILLYLGAKTQPTLNPEHSFWGSFNLTYLTDFMFSYSVTPRSKDDVSRFKGLELFGFKLYEESTSHFLIGEGAGKLIQSDFSENKGGDLIEKYYGIFYGGRMGFVWIYMQVGLIGLLLFLYFYLRIAFYGLKVNLHPLSLALNVIPILFLFDFFWYSSVFITYPVVNNLYFLIAAFLYKGNNDKSFLRFTNNLRLF